jgi:hypothetical protein
MRQGNISFHTFMRHGSPWLLQWDSLPLLLALAPALGVSWFIAADVGVIERFRYVSLARVNP